MPHDIEHDMQNLHMRVTKVEEKVDRIEKMLDDAEALIPLEGTEDMLDGQTISVDMQQ